MKTQQTIYAVCEKTPTASGDKYKVIIIRDRRADAEKILKVFNETDVDFSVYKIIERAIDKKDLTLI